MIIVVRDPSDPLAYHPVTRGTDAGISNAAASLMSCTKYCYPSLHDSSLMEYHLFPGIRLSLNRMYTTTMPFHYDGRKDYIIINYGLRGRSEQTLTDGNVTFVAAGELAISFYFSKGDFYFPNALYEGIEIYIDLAAVRSDPARTLASMGLNLDDMKALYGRNGFYKASHLGHVETLMQQIWQVKGDGSGAEFSRLCICTLALLRHLLYEKVPETEYANLRPENVACARAYENVLTRDLSRRISAKEMAARCHISETSLKNYFRIVYGENVSTYMNRCRMENAARKLIPGQGRDQESIGQIAAEVGFEGANKFSAAFRKWSGMTPSEYRRKHTHAE